jgi:hypothetical protein
MKIGPFLKAILCLSLCMTMLAHTRVSGQCQNNLDSRTYDTLVTGMGYGFYTLNFPKFNPDSGLLVSVTVRARVSVQYGFSLRNVAAKASTYTISVGREDAFSSPALTADFDNITEQTLGSFALNSGDTVGRDPFPLLNNYMNTDSITGSAATFLGTDNVTFTYSPITYTNIHSNNNSSYSYSATAADTVHFSVTYLFCRSQATLPIGVLRFNALAKDPTTVELIWTTANEASGRIYNIQRSSDGEHFTTIDSLASDPTGSVNQDYERQDHPPADIRKWYYRLQLVNGGNVSYSIIQQVTLPAPSTAGPDHNNTKDNGLPSHRIYPNPATDHINIVLAADGDAGGDWQVDVINAAGVLVQRQTYRQAHTVRIDFRQKLPAGVYFLRAADPHGQRSFNTSFVVTSGL